jgi:hypothetical protein
LRTIYWPATQLAVNSILITVVTTIPSLRVIPEPPFSLRLRPVQLLHSASHIKPSNPQRSFYLRSFFKICESSPNPPPFRFDSDLPSLCVRSDSTSNVPFPLLHPNDYYLFRCVLTCLPKCPRWKIFSNRIQFLQLRGTYNIQRVCVCVCVVCYNDTRKKFKKERKKEKKR